MNRLLTAAVLTIALIASTHTVSTANTPSSVTLCEQSEGAIQGSVTSENRQTDRKQTSPKRDLLENRQKRYNLTHQNPQVDMSRAKEMTVKSHAYCINGMTSRGVTTRRGVIAVDPRVIPYGSKIYVPNYGWGTALDTGGSIKGNTIDLWMPTRSQCMQWGTRTIKIKVITP